MVTNLKIIQIVNSKSYMFKYTINGVNFELIGKISIYTVNNVWKFLKGISWNY